ncbi:MAG: SpaA isopeptide-forming pilin-related protein [Reyranella sp.]|nr:SpaA isopeptide-forming pilin-related protein [Reyranella sp.]
MKLFAGFIAACTAGLIWTATHAQTTAKPIADTEVGLEHDPSNEMVAKGTTDREGNVTFSNLKPGRYRVVLTDRSKLKVPARVTISGTAAAPLVSEPIAEGQYGSKAYALGPDGKWILTEVGAPSTPSGGAANVVPGTIKVKVESIR